MCISTHPFLENEQKNALTEGIRVISKIIRKQLFTILLRLSNMGLLHGLFPGIEEFNELSLNGVPNLVPKWKDEEKPWSILSDNEDGIFAQIKEICTCGGEFLIETLHFRGTEVPQSDVFIHPSASIGEHVRIEGPCYIGANAEIRHSAYLRKGSWICEGAVVGHSTEVKNSLLLPYSKAPHFNYVGDSIVGFGVNLGAGAILSNVRNDKRTVVVSLDDGTRLETGLKKLGAMVGDGSQIGCNVVTNPGAIIPSNSLIRPNETITGWFGI